jgi:hypothetical protein
MTESRTADDRRMPSCKENAPRGEEAMKTEEMIEILESIIRDPETNPTARVTGIRCLQEIQERAGSWEEIDEESERALYVVPHRRQGPRAR